MIASLVNLTCRPLNAYDTRAGQRWAAKSHTRRAVPWARLHYPVRPPSHLPRASTDAFSRPSHAAQWDSKSPDGALRKSHRGLDRHADFDHCGPRAGLDDLEQRNSRTDGGGGYDGGGALGVAVGSGAEEITDRAGGDGC